MILELLAELLIEIVFQIGFEILAELGLTSTRDGPRTSQRHPAWAAVGIALLGSVVGALTVWLIPHRILPRPPVPGLSLVIGPLVAGGVMHLLGSAMARHGRAGSRLGTFWGGALFAFSFSLTRLLLISE